MQDDSVTPILASPEDPSPPATAFPSSAGPDLRTRLLHQPRNLELRTKYLATRTPDWALADLHLAGERLLAARALRGLLGLALVGAAGGALGELLASSASDGAWPVVVGLGSALGGALSFAVLGLWGCIVLPELVGEEWVTPHGQGFAGFLSRVREPLGDALCGGVWGALCGLFIGALSWPAGVLLSLPRFGDLDAVIAGAGGGMLLGGIFAVVLALVGKKDGVEARLWAQLGPLPAPVYFFRLQDARQRYLGKTRETASEQSS